MDVIVRGGETIHPRENENALLGHDGLVGVAVVGLPDHRDGYSGWDAPPPRVSTGDASGR